ncbi:MAG: hypothetical protein HQL65_10900, partial [Magnetococcales bacterium]|nr:hypothetical protein [Magnetococcales bacterium]
MSTAKRRQHNAGFKAKVAMDALKDEEIVAQLVSRYGIYPAMIHTWKKMLQEGAAELFEKGKNPFHPFTLLTQHHDLLR